MMMAIVVPKVPLKGEREKGKDTWIFFLDAKSDGRTGLFD